ncbi:MAG: hypothetical protein KKC68_04340 [Candidatus Thermoplasmatota archaeon]|nr:hypothetical protein [Candidatus Thermoplasmatota archaeon]MBU1940980.1 hypothetical protein [Candidatus Thermoplasmatota archaeon]
MTLDRDLPDSTWNRYLQLYGKHYRIYRDEIGIWTIKAKYGMIQPYSITKKLLVASYEFRSKNQKTFFLKRFKDFDIKITQEGVMGVSLCFNDCFLKKHVKELGIYRKYKISETELQRRTELLVKARQKKRDGHC